MTLTRPPNAHRLTAEEKADKPAARARRQEELDRAQTQRKLGRALRQVDRDRAAAKAAGKPYTGPSTTAWRRRARGWLRTARHRHVLRRGLFLTRFKEAQKVRLAIQDKKAPRRETRRQKRQRQEVAGPGMAGGPMSSGSSEVEGPIWRKYRRDQESWEAPETVGPPTSKKPSQARLLKLKAKRSLRKIRARMVKQRTTLAIEDAKGPLIKRHIRIKRKPKEKTKARVKELLQEIEKTTSLLGELLGQRVEDLGQVLSAAADASQVVPPAGDVGTATTGPRYPTRPSSEAKAQALAHARPKAAQPVIDMSCEPGYYVRTLLQEFLPAELEQDDNDEDIGMDEAAPGDGSVADDEGGEDAASVYPDCEDLEDIEGAEQ